MKSILCFVPYVQKRKGEPRCCEVREPQMQLELNPKMVMEMKVVQANRRSPDWPELGTKKVLKFLRICLMWGGGLGVLILVSQRKRRLGRCFLRRRRGFEEKRFVQYHDSSKKECCIVLQLEPKMG